MLIRILIELDTSVQVDMMSVAGVAQERESENVKVLLSIYMVAEHW